MLFDRVVSVLVGDKGSERALNVEGLRVVFDVERYASDTARNTATIDIYNLNPTQRAMIKRSGDAVILRAGYAKDKGLMVVFVGEITLCTVTKPQPDVLLRLQCGDGVTALNQTRMSSSYGPGTGAKQILRDAISALPISFGAGANTAAMDQVEDEKFDNGYVADGLATKTISDMTDKLGLEWSVQDGKFQIVKRGGTEQKTAYVLTPQSGLIGSPERRLDILKKDDKGRTKPGWIVKSVLLPDIYPTCKISVECAEIAKGSYFRVEKVTHRGDTHGEDWTTTMEVTDAAVAG